MRAITIKILLTLFVVIHLAGNMWHGNAHTILDVGLTQGQTIFVMAVIIVAPLVGAALLWTKRLMLGVWIVAVSMVESLLFSAYFHFIKITIDNIEHLPAGSVEAHAHFANSAQFIALAALAALILAFYAAGTLASTSE